MSDDLNIQINIKIYDKSSMLIDQRADLLCELMISVCGSKLCEMGFGLGAFSINGSSFSSNGDR